MRFKILIYILLITFLASCSSEKFLSDDGVLLRKVNVKCDNVHVRTSDLAMLNRQTPNTKWLSVCKVPLAIYSLAGKDSTKWINRTLHKLGEAPVEFDSLLAAKSTEDMTYAMYNKGFLNAKVTAQVSKTGRKAVLNYNIESGDPYIIRGVKYDIKDSVIASKLTSEHLRLHSGQQFSVDVLNAERKRIVSYLQNNGYYLFNKEYITFDIDSSEVDRSLYMTMHINPYQRSSNSAPGNHPIYTIRNVFYDSPPEGEVNLRQKVIDNNIAIRKGDLYSAATLQKTYSNFSRLQAVHYTSIHFNESPDSSALDCHILLTPQKENSIQFMPEGTNTAGDFGAAASLSYQNKNVFRGSEVLSLTLRGAYEAIHQLEGYQSQDYVEYGAEAGLLFPRLLSTFVNERRLAIQNATSELNFSYNLQNRPEFHRRMFNAAWRYRWSNANMKSQYKLDLLEINYLWMPWISETFKHDYIDSVSNRNVILRYNYEDLLIMKIGCGYTWRGDNGTSLRLSFETAGNILSALSHPLGMKQNEEGERQFLGIAFAQYAKGDVDYSHLIKIDERNALVLHGRVGVAYPYGNSTMLPFEKRYFSGGANSLRGWTVRSLGPGTFKGKDGRIDFINQSGDIRLDLNAELRTQLIWKIQGAVFLDAGNIWTARNYSDQPGGQFKFSTFWKQIAANYGLGMRLNLDYFIIRVDCGVKAVNPSGTTAKQQFPIISPNFHRDVAFHFAVGMPF